MACQQNGGNCGQSTRGEGVADAARTFCDIVPGVYNEVLIEHFEHPVEISNRPAMGAMAVEDSGLHSVVLFFR
jgi:hypothetical protein